MSAYPNDFKPTLSIQEFVRQWGTEGQLEAGETDHILVQLSARVYNARLASKSLAFYDITSYGRDKSTLQVLFSKKIYNEECTMHYGSMPYDEARARIKRGTLVGLTGYPHRSKAGELSLLCMGLRILVQPSADRPIDPKCAVSRSLQYVIYPETKNNIYLRAALLKTLRNFFDSEGLIEVETPMLERGTGANAQPFKTYHNAQAETLNLRVAPELYLKMLIMGEMGPIYEIGKQFRNEGQDATHNPEFTSCELYIPDHTVYDLMPFTERLLYLCAEKAQAMGLLSGPLTFWEPPYRRIDILPELERLTGESLDPTLPEAVLRERLERLTKTDKTLSLPKLYDTLIADLLETQCDRPTFLVDHPALMCPLSHCHADRPQIAQRFELFIRGRELCNAYSELNSPQEQRAKLAAQEALRGAGDQETIGADEEYCNVMDYGMCPTAGWGMGLDRLLMALTETAQIRDTLTF